MPESNKITARTSSAAGKTTKGLSPTDWGDKCYLCTNTFGESDPRGFFPLGKSNVLAHRGCINKMEAAGGHPRDFHRVMAEKKQPPGQHVAAVAAEPVEQTELANTYKGPRVIQFEDFGHLQRWIAEKGPLPTFVRVLVGSYVMQGGGG